MWGNQLLYTQFYFAFQVPESGVILKMTAESWQTSQPVQPPGVSSVLFPPRNLGCLTKNRPNFPKATIIQPLSSPPLTKKASPRTSLYVAENFCFSPCFSVFPFFVLFRFSQGKMAVINDQVVFVCTVLGFRVDSSVW